MDVPTWDLTPHGKMTANPGAIRQTVPFPGYWLNEVKKAVLEGDMAKIEKLLAELKQLNEQAGEYPTNVAAQLTDVSLARAPEQNYAYKGTKKWTPFKARPEGAEFVNGPGQFEGTDSQTDYKPFVLIHKKDLQTLTDLLGVAKVPFKVATPGFVGAPAVGLDAPDHEKVLAIAKDNNIGAVPIWADADAAGNTFEGTGNLKDQNKRGRRPDVEAALFKLVGELDKKYPMHRKGEVEPKEWLPAAMKEVEVTIKGLGIPDALKSGLLGKLKVHDYVRGSDSYSDQKGLMQHLAQQALSFGTGKAFEGLAETLSALKKMLGESSDKKCKCGKSTLAECGCGSGSPYVAGPVPTVEADRGGSPDASHFSILKWALTAAVRDLYGTVQNMKYNVSHGMWEHGEIETDIVRKQLDEIDKIMARLGPK